MTDYTMTVDANGVNAIAPQSEGLYCWGRIAEIASADEHIFIYVSPYNALIVPPSAFANASEREEFLNTVRRYREEAVGLDAELNQ